MLLFLSKTEPLMSRLEWYH